MTSRPDNDAEFNPSLAVVKLEHTSPKEIPYLIDRLCISGDAELAEPLKTALKSNYKIQEALVSPLMVALLVSRFRTDPAIPNTIAGLYDGILEFMFVRRDRSKFLTRERASDFEFGIIEAVVNHASFELRKRAAGNTFRRRTILECFEHAAQQADVPGGGGAILEDVQIVSNLIIREGDIYEYLHKTIMEFFAARYVLSRSEEARRRVYRGVTKKHRLYWNQELRFLSLMDKTLYNEVLLVPAIEKTEEKLRRALRDNALLDAIRDPITRARLRKRPDGSWSWSVPYRLWEHEAYLYDNRPLLGIAIADCVADYLNEGIDSEYGIAVLELDSSIELLKVVELLPNLVPRLYASVEGYLQQAFSAKSHVHPRGPTRKRQ